MLCAALALLPLAARRRDWARARVLASPLVVYAVLIALAYVLTRYTPLRIPPFAPFSKVRGAMALLGLAFHGYGVVFPVLYLAVAGVLGRAKSRSARRALPRARCASSICRTSRPTDLASASASLRSRRATARPIS